VIEQIAVATRAVRSSLRAALDGVGSPDRSRLMARELGINRGLAWRVAKALATTSASELLRALPRPKSMAVLLDACLIRGAREQDVACARDALKALEDALTACGEDRGSVPVLLVASGFDGEQCAHFASSRHQLFEGARILWGAEADLGLRLVIAWPGSNGELNGALVRATLGLAVLRPGAWTISYSRFVDEENREQLLGERPIDEPATSAAGAELPLMERFCSPRPLHVTVDESRGIRRYMVTPTAIGRAGELNCVLGTWAPNQYWEATRPEDPGSSVMTIVETPMRRLQLDLLLHPDVALLRSSRVIVCDRLTRPHGFDLSRIEQERLPLDGTPQSLGRGVTAMATPRIAWYEELLAHVGGRLGLELDRFRGWRHEMTYPPIATAAILQFWAARRAPQS